MSKKHDKDTVLFDQDALDALSKRQLLEAIFRQNLQIMDMLSAWLGEEPAALDSGEPAAQGTDAV